MRRDRRARALLIPSSRRREETFFLGFDPFSMLGLIGMWEDLHVGNEGLFTLLSGAFCERRYCSLFLQVGRYQGIDA